MRRRWMLAFGIAGLTAGCSGSYPTAPTIPVDGETAGVERWACGDYFDGCLFNCPVKLTADFHMGTGTVEIAGTVKDTRFELKGLQRRWDWCPEDDGAFGCAFVLSTDGDGKYFNFAGVMPDSDGQRRTKPSDLFKCARRR